ncbi:MAG: alpha/beta hydrolase [Gammaproteobacteria bacterium]|jgi:pimeloyl-ACP methyl ester carboxylesterase
MLTARSQRNRPRLSGRETILLDQPRGGPRPALHLRGFDAQQGPCVLFLHGATFPSALATGFEFSPGDSWADCMADRQCRVAELDFPGFGDAEDPPGLSADAAAQEPIGRAGQAAEFVISTLDWLRSERGVTRVHLVAHSWGTVAAGVVAADRPGSLVSLTLFGPIVPAGAAAGADRHAGWYGLSAEERYQQLRYLPILGPNADLLEGAVHSRWRSAFAGSRPGGSADLHMPLRIPGGPAADIAAVRAGRLPYDPAAVRAPLFVVYGNHDNLVDDRQAAAFAERFPASPLKWRLRIDPGTHVMHLERQRQSLYLSTLAFIHAAGGVGE